MKVEYFIDEMPRDCASCKHYYMNCADGYSCSKLRKEIHPNFSEGMGYRIKECPLQSLSDYTKQVRKEVCEEIKDIVKQIARPTTEYDDGTFDYDIDAVELDHLLIWLKNGEMDLIKHHLDQIQGETKC